jgi:hypothetical protein
LELLRPVQYPPLLWDSTRRAKNAAAPEQCYLPGLAPKRQTIKNRQWSPRKTC